MCLLVHNISAVGFVVLHFITIILDLNVEYVFCGTCALRANFGRFVTVDYFKKNPASPFSFHRTNMDRLIRLDRKAHPPVVQSQFRRAGIYLNAPVAGLLVLAPLAPWIDARRLESLKLRGR